MTRTSPAWRAPMDMTAAASTRPEARSGLSLTPTTPASWCGAPFALRAWCACSSSLPTSTEQDLAGHAVLRLSARASSPDLVRVLDAGCVASTNCALPYSAITLVIGRTQKTVTVFVPPFSRPTTLPMASAPPGMSDAAALSITVAEFLEFELYFETCIRQRNMYSLSQLSHVPLSDALVQRVLSSFESFPGFLNKRFEQERLLPSLPRGTNACSGTLAWLPMAPTLRTAGRVAKPVAGFPTIDHKRVRVSKTVFLPFSGPQRRRRERLAGRVAAHRCQPL